MTIPFPVYVAQGTFAVSHDPRTCFTTVLGSCVAACAWDADRGLGGMNHLLLAPSGDRVADLAEPQGIHLMELLINGLMRSGARKPYLKVKLFGGAKIITGLSDIGARNAEFARTFFRHEGIEIAAENLGGTRPRKLQFWPSTGRARLKFVSMTEAPPPIPPPAPAVPQGEIELF